MAITKLMHMKMDSRGGSSHLKNSLAYILKEEKTMNGVLVGGNCGPEAKAIYDTFMDTKQFYQKENGRQGYHFVISFDKFEATESQAYAVVESFCKQYFGDVYEHVFAIHNDQDHMHGHIIFNSVSRSNGLKFHSPKGDWENNIQPLVDKICLKHGLSVLHYEKNNRKGKHYAEDFAEKNNQISWKKIIVRDIDFAIKESNTYDDFFVNMKKLGYELRVGNSQKHGEYFSIKAPGATRARRNYQLGNGYSLDDIKDKIVNKIYEPVYQRTKRIQRTNLYRRPRQASYYQITRIRFLYQTQSYRRKSMQNHYYVNHSVVRKQLLEIQKIRDSCQYIMRQNIRTEAQLLQREDYLKMQQKYLKGDRKRAYEFSEPAEKIKAINQELRGVRNELSIVKYCKKPQEKGVIRKVGIAPAISAVKTK